MASFARELRQAWRSLLQRKAYFLTCAATLTLVLAANAAMFAVVNATMLRPLPFATSGDVVHLYSQPPKTTGAQARNPMQQMEVSRMREQVRTLARLEGYFLFERVITLQREPAVAQTASVTVGLLPMMAARVATGRMFLESEGQPGQFVALISDRYWRETLGGGSVLGSPLIIDGQPHTIVGILAPGFAVPFMDAQIFTPLWPNPEPQRRSPPLSVQAVGELAPGATVTQLREELNGLNRRLAQDFPITHTGWELGAEPFREWQYGSMRGALFMLLAAGALVLLIACANIANLASGQAIARSGELALRVALGATRGDILRMHLAELLIVCASGLIPGLLLASAAVPALLRINPTVARTLGSVNIDWRVQLFGLCAAVLTAVGASAIPAARAMRGHLSPIVPAGGRRTTGSPVAVRLQHALVSVEVALCVALLMAGAIVVQGLRDVSRRNVGYEPAGVLTAQIRLPDPAYKEPALRAAVVDQMLTRIRALPGVTGASTTLNNFTPGFSIQTLVNIKGHPTPDGQPHTVQFRRVSTDYFRTLQIRLQRGRTFSSSDVANQPQVAIVSRTFAERLLPGDPIGQIILRQTPNPPPITVIGVVDDVLDISVTQAPEPTLYLAHAQNNNTNAPVAFVIRTSVEPLSIAPAVRGIVKDVDPTLPLRRVQLMDTFLRETTAPDRFRTMMLGIIAALGLVLAAVGIAGVTYRGVVDRTREFAVRLALGSRPDAVLRLVVLESARDLAAGAIAGIAAGAALCALLARSLDNVGAVDAVTTSGAIGLIVTVGIAAACLPALRVLRLHPADVLRG